MKDMNELNEQIIFFKDVCLENSYLNEDSPGNRKVVQARNRQKAFNRKKNLAKGKPIFKQNVPQTEEEPEVQDWYKTGFTITSNLPAVKNDMFSELEMVLASDYSVEDVDYEEVEDEPEDDFIEDPIKLIVKEPFKIDLNPMEFRMIPLEQVIKFEYDKNNININAVRIDTVQCYSSNIYCGAFSKYSDSKDIKDILEDINKKYERARENFTDDIDIKKLVESIQESTAKLGDTSKICLFLYAVSPCERYVPISVSLDVEYEQDGETFEVNGLTNDLGPIGEVKVNESNDVKKGNNDNNDNTIPAYVKLKFSDIDFKFPAGKNTLYLSNNEPINLKEFFYLKQDNGYYIRYDRLSKEKQEALPLEWNIIDPLSGNDSPNMKKMHEAANSDAAKSRVSVKNLFALKDGKLYMPKTSTESFEKLKEQGVFDKDNPSVDVAVWLKDNAEKNTIATINIVDSKNSVKNFSISVDKEEDASIGFSEYVYDVDCFVGRKRNLYINIDPSTALPEYYSIDVSTKYKDLIKLSKVGKEDKYELEIDSSSYKTFLELYSSEDKKGKDEYLTIDFTLYRFKTDQTGDLPDKINVNQTRHKKTIESKIVKKVVVRPIEIPKDLEITADNTKFELKGGEKDKSVKYKIVLTEDNKKLDIKEQEPYKKLFDSGELSVKAVSTNGNLVGVNSNNGEISLNAGQSDGGTANVYLFLTSSLGAQKTIATSEIPDEAKSLIEANNIQNIIAYAVININVYTIIKQFTIDVPPKPSSYDVLMAPMIGGKGGVLFGIRHYTTNPEREIESTNDRAISLLGKANPVKFFSDIIGKYMNGHGEKWSAKNLSNSSDKRKSNAAGRDYELRDMSNPKVNNQFRARNASTWRESVEYDFSNVLYEASPVNKLKPQNDLQKCQDYFKEVYNNYTQALNIIYGDETQKFQENVKNEVVRSFAERNITKIDGSVGTSTVGINPVAVFTMVQNKIRSFAGSLTTMGNKNIASFKKLGEDLDEFAKNANDTMINKIENAFANIFTGKIKGLGDGTDKTSVPLKQADLKNLWAGYYKKLQRDAVTFQNKFINSESFAYTRKILNLTIPDILALDITAIAVILNKNEDVLGISVEKYPWENLFNYTTTSQAFYDESNKRNVEEKEKAKQDVKELAKTYSKQIKYIIKNIGSKFTETEFDELLKAVDNDREVIYRGSKASATYVFIKLSKIINSYSYPKDKVKLKDEIDDFYSDISLKTK